MKINTSPFLYAVTPDFVQLPPLSFYNRLQWWLDHGLHALQWRTKHLPLKQQLSALEKIQALLARYPTQLIINDCLKTTQSINAQGIHLGQTDTPLSKARKMLGSSQVIGHSINHPHQLTPEVYQNANYIALSPLYRTTSKPDASTPVTHEQAIQIRTRWPRALVAIGGITKHNIHPVLDLGINGIAGISSFFGPQNPQPFFNQFNNYGS